MEKKLHILDMPNAEGYNLVTFGDKDNWKVIDDSEIPFWENICEAVNNYTLLQEERDRLKNALKDMCKLWENASVAFPAIINEPKYLAAKYLLNNK